MDNYETIKLNNGEYYLATDIYDFDNAFFYGTNNNIRNIINKKKIANDDHIYAYIKNKEWILSNKKYCKSKVLLTKKWCIDNVPNFTKHSNVVAEIEKLPPLLDLDDDQKFTDGKAVYDIKIRGERDMDKCYFSVVDVGKAFELKNLSKTVTDKDKGYDKDIHYKYFTNVKFPKGKNMKVKKGQKDLVKVVYFTYSGIIRCLNVSKSKKAKLFQRWANKILFTHQFGNQEEKQELASKLLGTHYTAVKEVFKTSATTIPCIYLFTLGTAKQLRKSMTLPKTIKDDEVICKYGMTDSLERRSTEHARTFKKIKNANLHLKFYAYIDPQYISDAENDLSDYFNALNVKIKYDNMKELVSLSPKTMNGIIKKQFTNMTNLYAGHVKELINKIKTLEDKLILQEQLHKNELLQKEKELLQKEKELSEIKKDNEIQIMRLELEYLKKN